MNGQSKKNVWARIGPGIVVAAAGIGAGDLATASLAGSHLGTSVLWAVVIGVIVKYAINEGLGRFQLATGQTFLEGVGQRLGKVFLWLFLPYLIFWSFCVGSALMSVCGIVASSIIPLSPRLGHSKQMWGVIHGVFAFLLAWLGGFQILEKVVSLCSMIMVATALLLAWQFWPGTSAVLKGIFVPTFSSDKSGLGWTVALMGGVGGTLTLLCYGYWIREVGRADLSSLPLCRFDLALGYGMTALFGMAMVILGSRIQIAEGGEKLIILLAEQVESRLGLWGRGIFLAGAWGTVVSSLVSVWQSVPYLFADTYRILRRNESSGEALTRTVSYRAYLIGFTLIPMFGLLYSFKEIQKLYAVIGALFMPLLSLTLLYLNGKRAWIAVPARNNSLSKLILLGSVVLFLGLSFYEWGGLSK